MRLLRAYLVVALSATVALASAAHEALHVLFIGNSYTYVNNLPGFVSKLAEFTDGPKIETEQVTNGGWTLEQHFASQKTLDKIRSRKWDYVVLQEQSTRPIEDPEKMFKAVRSLSEEIKKTGAKTLLYLTWSRKKTPETQEKLTESYEKIGEEIGAHVVSVGPAWEALHKLDPAMELYMADGSHPSQLGTYLGAILFLQAFSGHIPAALPTTLTQIPAAEEGQSAFDVLVGESIVKKLRLAATKAAK